MRQIPPTNAMPDDLQTHLAFEVDWLVYAAENQRHQRRKAAVVFQTNAMLNARNLLEFTQPSQAPKHGWWICQFGGAEPAGSQTYEDWQEFINSKVTHLGERRLQEMDWPHTGDVVMRHVELANFCLDRIEAFAPDESHPCGKVMRNIVTLGKRYLGGDESALAELDRLTEGAKRVGSVHSTSTSDMAIHASDRA